MLERRVVTVFGGSIALHREIKSDLDFADVIVSGMPIQAVKNLQRYIGASDLRMAELISITPKTFRSRKERFNKDEGNHAYTLARIIIEAEKAIGEKDEALKWLTSNQLALGNRKPIELILTTAGAQAVEDLLGRITYGVYS